MGGVQRRRVNSAYDGLLLFELKSSRCRDYTRRRVVGAVQAGPDAVKEDLLQSPPHSFLLSDVHCFHLCKLPSYFGRAHATRQGMVKYVMAVVCNVLHSIKEGIPSEQHICE